MRQGRLLGCSPWSRVADPRGSVLMSNPSIETERLLLRPCCDGTYRGTTQYRNLHQVYYAIERAEWEQRV